MKIYLNMLVYPTPVCVTKTNKDVLLIFYVNAIIKKVIRLRKGKFQKQTNQKMKAVQSLKALTKETWRNGFYGVAIQRDNYQE